VVGIRAVPRWRENILLTGSLDVVRDALVRRLGGAPRHELAPYIYADIIDPEATLRPQGELLELLQRHRPGARMVRYREQRSATARAGASDLVAIKRLEEMSEAQVFEYIYRRENQDQELPDELRRAFSQLMAELAEDNK
jgi:hypothetical protein